MALADEYPNIARERRRIRLEGGLPDDNWRTATGADLGALAVGYGLDRRMGEYDEELRSRIEAAADRIRNRSRLC